MKNVPELFGSMVFNEKVMRERLPKDVYRAVKHTMETGGSLESSMADVVANAMKDWAIEKGATHYTHWFQPLTGITAEKHDSFISSIGEGAIIMEFRGKELIKGEPDASSFPSGGLRATFEARGYTAWDPTSYAFIKDDTLFVPSAFYSYSGAALDKKTPLLRSMETINTCSLRVLELLGCPAKHVKTTIGAEQEYFLIPKELYEKRKDLLYTGRTLFGAKPPKSQELEDHYFGSIKPRVSAYMKDLDEELWKLGVYAKTEHNESAPAQHELAPIFETTNVACDHNQLTMEMMKKVALRHGLVCLLHEKPFAYVNGSGKHNNWSLLTDAGENLLDPKKKPSENTRFLTFFAAVLKAADEHQDLLRIAVASAGNDLRLGVSEAPPAIVSLFVGTELEEVLEAIVQGRDYVPNSVGVLDTSVAALPNLYIDTTDRNRTSPFAFTGNKFEFRMLGASQSVSDINIFLNTIVADALDFIGDSLESGAKPIDVIRDIIIKHGRIIFNGNNYAPEWVIEAEKRGLLNLRSTPDALPLFASDKNIALFEKYKVFSREELQSRAGLMLENYCKVLGIEAATMITMVRREILPAAVRYSREVTKAALSKKELALDYELELKLAIHLGDLMKRAEQKTTTLETIVTSLGNGGFAALAMRYRSEVIPAMNDLRVAIDLLEEATPADSMSLPSYGDLMFSI